MAARPRRIPRGCLVSLAAVLIVGLAVLFLARRALDTAFLRQQAEARLEEALGQPVSIGAIDVNWLPVPSVKASDITVGAKTNSPPSLSLGSVLLVPRLSSLLSGPIFLRRVELSGLDVQVLRDREGRLHLPVAGLPAPTGQETGEQASIEVGEVALRDARLTVIDEQQGRRPGRSPSITDIAAMVRREDAVTRLESLSGRIGESRLSGSGTIGPEGLRLSLAWHRLSAGDVPEVFGLAGVAAPQGISVEGDEPLRLEVALDPAGHLTASGEVAADKASLQTFTLTSLRSPVRLSGDRLTLDPLTFDAYGGRQRGSATANIGVQPMTWALETAIEGVDMRRLVNDNTSADDTLSGTGSLRGRLQGVFGEQLLDRAGGKLSVALADGALHDFPLLAALNAALGIAAGDVRDLRFDTLSATLQVGGGKAVTDDLLLKSGELTAAGAGTLGLDQSLDFKGVVTLSRERVAQLVGSVKEVARLKNREGEIAVPVTVSGTVAEPRFAVDLAAALRQGAEEELRRRLKKGLEGIIK